MPTGTLSIRSFSGAGLSRRLPAAKQPEMYSQKHGQIRASQSKTSQRCRSNINWPGSCPWRCFPARVGVPMSPPAEYTVAVTEYTQLQSAEPPPCTCAAPRFHFRLHCKTTSVPFLPAYGDCVVDSDSMFARRGRTPLQSSCYHPHQAGTLTGIPHLFRRI